MSSTQAPGTRPGHPGEPASTRRRRWPVLPWALALAIVVLLHGVSAWYVLRLYLNNAPDLYYPAGSPAVELRDELRRQFPSDELLTVVFQGPDLYGRGFLTRLDGLARELQRHPLVDRVTTVTTLERISGSEDGFAVGALVDEGAIDDLTGDALRQRVLGDRFAPGLLASRDGSTMAMAVRPKELAGSAERLQLQLATIAAVRDAGLLSYYAGDAGPITVDVAQLMSMMRDTQVFVPLTASIGLLLLGWVVGRLRPVVIGAVAMSTVILPVIAGVAATGQPYTMATAILPSLLAAYTMATLLHFYGAVQRAQSGRLSRRHSVERGLSETLRPGMYNVLTTCAGLLSLTLVPMPPIQVFGLAGAAGTALVFLTVYVLVPPFLMRWDNRRWPTRRSTMGHMGRAATRMALWSIRHARPVVGGFILLGLLGLPMVASVEVETDVLAFFAPSHPVNRATDLVETKLAGVTSLEVSVRASQRDGLQRAQALHALRALQDWMESLPEIDRTVSMVDLVEEMHWAMNEEREGFRALPPDDALISQYLLIYDGNDLWELVDRDFQHARLMLNLNVHGAREIGRTIDRIRAYLAEHPLPVGMSVDIGGYGRLFADQVDLLVSGQIKSFASAFVQIFLLMALLWRSFTSSAVCMLPNVAPLFFIFVLMGATGIHLDMATVMIAGVVLGITVDDTIHLFHGYRERLRRGMSPAMAIARAYRSAGRAVLATTVLLTAQFALLATSDFIPTANFGLMTAVGLFAGQAGELFLLPALLALLHARRRGAPWKALWKGRGPPALTPAPAATEWAPTVLIEREGLSDPGMSSLPRNTQDRGSGDTGLRPAAAAAAPAGAAPPSDMADLRRVADGCPSVMASVQDGPDIQRTAEAVTARILVCQGPACLARGGDELWRALVEAMPGATVAAGGSPTRVADVAATPTGCLGACAQAPVVYVVADPVDAGAEGVEAMVDRTLARARELDLGPASRP
ncbi:MAG: MMPL family transporter [Burkholderiaceae bacterium]